MQTFRLGDCSRSSAPDRRTAQFFVQSQDICHCPGRCSGQFFYRLSPHLPTACFRPYALLYRRLAAAAGHHPANRWSSPAYVIDDCSHRPWCHPLCPGIFFLPYFRSSTCRPSSTTATLFLAALDAAAGWFERSVSFGRYL